MTQSFPLPYQGVTDLARWETDRAHLRTLAICHYVWGGLIMLLSCLFIFHIVFGIILLNNPSFLNGPKSQPPPPGMGWMLIIMGSVAILLGWASGFLTILSGRFIRKQRHRIFSLVMAGISCLSIPLGTTLGVFTFIVLCRDSVRRMYELNQPRIIAPVPPPQAL